MYEDLVERLRTCGSSLSCIKCKWDPDCGGTGEVLRKAVDAIEGLLEISKRYYALLEKMPRWIPVEERLPEKYDCYYLVVLNNWNTDFCLYTKEKGFGMYITPKWWDANDEVTHWMPLPESPKEVT